MSALKTLDMLSRLKGIETSLSIFFPSKIMFTLDMLSRLKGIETLLASESFAQA